jgi:hypothetical protein
MFMTAVKAALQEAARRWAAVELIELLKSDAIEIRDHEELRRLNWRDNPDRAVPGEAASPG